RESPTHEPAAPQLHDGKKQQACSPMEASGQLQASEEEADHQEPKSLKTTTHNEYHDGVSEAEAPAPTKTKSTASTVRRAGRVAPLIPLTRDYFQCKPPSPAEEEIEGPLAVRAISKTAEKADEEEEANAGAVDANDLDADDIATASKTSSPQDEPANIQRQQSEQHCSEPDVFAAAADCANKAPQEDQEPAAQKGVTSNAELPEEIKMEQEVLEEKQVSVPVVPSSSTSTSAVATSTSLVTTCASKSSGDDTAEGTSAGMKQNSFILASGSDRDPGQIIPGSTALGSPSPPVELEQQTAEQVDNMEDELKNQHEVNHDALSFTGTTAEQAQAAVACHETKNMEESISSQT
ncbi:unnamed protein product, partial [Amoebophrya sp. A120]